MPTIRKTGPDFTLLVTDDTDDAIVDTLPPSILQGTPGERPLPAGWQRVRFDQMAESITDRVDDPSEAGVAYYVGLEHLDPESLKIRRWGQPTDVEATKLRFKPGDIIFGKRRAYQRKLAVAEFEGICSAHALVLRARQDVVLPEFLPFFMQSDIFFERAMSISVGSLSPTINWKTLAAQEFAMTPREEQRRIAELLWAADEAVEGWRNVIQPVNVAKQVVLDELFAIESNSTQSSKTVFLRDVCRMQNGRPFPSEDYLTTGVKLLRPGNLGIDGYFDWGYESTRCLPEQYLISAKEYIIQEGDVVINLTAQSLDDGFMGRVCIALNQDISLLNQRIGRFICDNELYPEYLYRCLQTASFRKLVDLRCEGSKVKHLYWRHLEDFQIPLPNIEEQKYRADILQKMDQNYQKTKNTLMKSIQLYTKLRETLTAYRNSLSEV